jgi:hypothetical protein
MKRITAIAILAVANLAMAGTSFGQSKVVKADVPFEFTVGNQLLPAGTYTIRTETQGVIAIKNHDKPVAVYALVGQDGAKAPSGGKLVFHKYGNRYFLNEILCSWADMNVTVRRSNAEKTIQIQQAMGHPSSEVFIAAR